MTQETLFTSFTEVQPEWIDYNGHMNMGYYLVAFDPLGLDFGKRGEECFLRHWLKMLTCW